jgi:hypothetical protein
VLRRHGAGQEPGKKADQGDEHDRERCRRPGTQLIGRQEVNENGGQTLLCALERLCENNDQHDDRDQEKEAANNRRPYR